MSLTRRGGFQQQGLVFDAKCEYMTKKVSSTGGGLKCASSTEGGVNDKGGYVVRFKKVQWTSWFYGAHNKCSSKSAHK